MTAVTARAGSRPFSAWPLACVGVTFVGVAAGVAALVVDRAAPLDFRHGLAAMVCYLVPYGLAGAFLIRRRPDLPFGWLLAGSATLLTVGLLAQGIGAAALLRDRGGNWPVLAAELGEFQLFAVAVQGLINVRFPGGRLESRFGRILNALMIVGLFVLLPGGLAGAATADQISADLHRTVRNPLTGDGTLAHAADALLIGGPVIVLLGLIAGIRVVVLARRAHGLERQQLMWRAAGVVVSLVLFVPAVTEVLPAAADFADGTVFVATLLIPVLWYQLWDIDTVIRHSAGYVVVTVLLALAYLVVAVIGAAIASERAGIVVGAFVVAMAYGPARSASQRVVDRLFYGQRNDPYKALSEVNRRLAAVAETGTVLPAVVSGIATSLRLPYVAISRDDVVVAAHGTPPADSPARWELTYRGTPVGTLLAAPRGGETAFGRRDREVLSGLADQLGAAVHAEALTGDLLESRQRLVNAREDERRRLRRELHDSLGPMLTALGLNVDAARARLAAVPVDVPAAAPTAVSALAVPAAAVPAAAALAGADSALASARDIASRAMVDLRGLVHGLRPPALDDLGLTGAVRANAARLAEGVGVTVTVTPDDVGELPAAVEVAAFRIAVEAVSNVVRHSSARGCTVRFILLPGHSLTVDVADDCPGDAAWRPGVGLLGMRERAEELGGDLDAGPTADGGRVHARLPLVEAR
jgi:two-component system NarL family sensor kinase